MSRSSSLLAGGVDAESLNSACHRCRQVAATQFVNLVSDVLSLRLRAVRPRCAVVSLTPQVGVVSEALSAFTAQELIARDSAAA